MSNNELNIGDLLPPDKNTEQFVTSDSVIPQFVKEAAYTPDETAEQTIQQDWERLVKGLSDYVLAEQLTERELKGMGKPLAENYAAYFHMTLADVKKARKKAEQKLFKLIPRHSQLDTASFFEEVREQNEKETESRERSIEVYPRAGIAKEAAWTAPEARPGSMTNTDPGECSKCKCPIEALKGMLLDKNLFCMKCHDSGSSIPPNAKAPRPLPPVATQATCEGLMKQAAAKWKPGQYLAAKHNGAEACVAYVNEEDKTYIIKVCGTLYPSYYSWEDAHETFMAKSEDEVDGVERKSRGV